MKLFASDIDNTLIPKKDPLIIEDIRDLEKKIEGMKVVYISGRNLSLIAEVMPLLPEADFIGADVGTSIYCGKSFQKNEEYENYLMSDGYNRKELEEKLKDIKGLYMQEYDAQKEAKLSYYLDDESSLVEMERIIKNTPAKLIYSVDPVKNIGLVDIIPKRGGKEGVLGFLSDKLKLQKSDVVFAGDSGNDTGPLDKGFNSIIVANAPESLKTYFKNHPNVYIAKQSYCKGVVEGIKHFTG